MASFLGSSSADSTMLLLPFGYAGSMVLFTVMRKIGMAKYLKPHQFSVAGAVGLTVAIYGAYYAGFLRGNPENFRALTFVLQNALFCFALNRRNEMTRGAMILNIMIASLIGGLCAFQSVECDRYASLVMFILSMLLAGSALAIRSAEDSRKRENVLHGVWAVFGVLTCLYCDTETMPFLYACVGMSALFITKIAHPFMGDKMGGEEGLTTGDVEASTWRM